MSAAELLEHVLGYAARGWPVLPLCWPITTGSAARCSCGSAKCRRIGKHPLAQLVPHGLTEATTEGARVRQWWRRVPLANIGIVLGPRSGMFALDVDPRHGGDRGLVEFVRARCPLGPTLHQITGSGGDHYFFRWPVAGVAGGAHKLGPGLDVQGDRFYVVASPSLHPSGARYRWEDLDAPPLDAPAWLLARLAAPPLAHNPPPAPASSALTNVLERASAYVARMPPAIAGSGGHRATLLAAIALVRGFALPPEAAVDLLAREYNPRCLPPWSRRELARKVAVAAHASRVGRPGYLLNQSRGAA